MVEFPEIPANGSADLVALTRMLQIGEDHYPASVNASIALAPEPRIVLRGVVEPKQHPFEFFRHALELSDTAFLIEPSDERVSLLLTQWSVGERGTFTGVIRGGNPIVGERAASATVEFGILNFPDVLAQEGGKTYRNSFDLSDDLLGIEVQIRPSSESPFNVLKEQGGYGVTHYGVIKHRNGNNLTFDTASNALDGLQYFLSFCRGAWASPFLATGCEGREVIWRELSNRQVYRWSSSVSWLDRHNVQAAQEAFPGFCRLWSDALWNKALRTSIYWYLRSNSNSAGVDGSLILTQAALEHLAWHTLVEHGQRVSGEGFERLAAADQLRLFLSGLDIPRAVPSTLEQLARLARELNWDGPAAFTEIRNNLVHPGRKRRRLEGRKIPYFEAWLIGQWYLELALLRLFEFSGVYHDRTRLNGWTGNVVRAPWNR